MRCGFIKACRGKGLISLSRGDADMTAEGSIAPQGWIFFRWRGGCQRNAEGSIAPQGWIFFRCRGGCRRNAEGSIAPQAQLFLPPEKAAGKRPLKGGNLSTFPPLRNPSFQRPKEGTSPVPSLETPLGLVWQWLICGGNEIRLVSAQTFGV